MDKNKNYLALKKLSQGLGGDLFGVADIRPIKKEFMLSQRLIAKFDQAVCFGIRLSKSVLEEIENSPTKLYFHHYRTVNAFLDQLALKITNFIQNKGYSALPVPASQIVDWQNQKAHLSHKRLGVLAGIGWIGRNNLLVNKNYGSQFRLASILTNMPLRVDKPVATDCGKCRVCVTICPAGAIKENFVEFDHMRCFEKLKEFQKQKLVDQYICGICVKVCKGVTKHG